MNKSVRISNLRLPAPNEMSPHARSSRNLRIAVANDVDVVGELVRLNLMDLDGVDVLTARELLAVAHLHLFELLLAGIGPVENGLDNSFRRIGLFGRINSGSASSSGLLFGFLRFLRSNIGLCLFFDG